MATLNHFAHFKAAKSVPVATAGKAHVVAQPAFSTPEAEKILSAFDLAAEFGPSIGLSRAERWERAQQLGLAPPVEVRAAMQAAGVEGQSVFARAMA
ncbi:hypothetical protein T492DRAFT_993658 [Pavlovales sp. CCMP2436]|nr:hypothetical protein T492DRAFT_993658 [Pavlovales sp. CCMP2436]